MRTHRIGLALAAVAGTAMTVAGAPDAAATVEDLNVYVGDYTHSERWMITGRTSVCSGVIWILDNGKPVTGKAIDPGKWQCEKGYPDYYMVPWRPTTTGMHHIVMEQRDASGAVLSSMSRDAEVKQTPCVFIDGGSAGYAACNVMSGSGF